MKYLSRGAGYRLFLTSTEAVLSLRKSGAEPENGAPADPAAVRMKVLGANPCPEIAGLDELAGKSNHFKGTDSSQWWTDVPQYARVSYREVYPGVDLVYYGKQRRLEYDFVVSPGADPRVVSLQFEGPEAVKLDEGGNLVLEVHGGRLVQHAPNVYQDVGGERRRVAGDYVLHGEGRVGFKVGDYDASRPLVIDPVLAYSTYLGGSDGEFSGGIAIDSSGSAYVAGRTFSTNFPTLGPFQTNQGAEDVFVTKVSPAGSSLIYSTYLGSSGIDAAYGIAVDGSGNAYVTGQTDSAAFPTMNPYLAYQGLEDAVVTKLSPGGSSAVYSAPFAGGLNDWNPRVVVDGAGSAYVTGMTDSAAFPTVNPYQTAQGLGDTFVLKLVESTPYSFYTVPPCRIVDTRNTSGPLGGPALSCSSAPLPRSFPLGGACGIPTTARAVAYNVAATQGTASGHLRLFAAGSPMPAVSSINYSANATRGNNGVALLGTGYLNVSCHQASGTAQVIIDVNGYFE